MKKSKSKTKRFVPKSYDYSFATGETKKIVDEDNRFYSDTNLDSTVLDVLQKNPFIYDVTCDKVTVLSIEDFYISYKKRKMSLGSLVHNELFTKRQKLKYTKKAFKKWKKDFELKRADAINIGTSTVSTLLDFQYKKLNILMMFLSSVFLVLSIIFLMYFNKEYNEYFKEGLLLKTTDYLLALFDKYVIWRVITYLAVIFNIITVLIFIVLIIYCSVVKKKNKRARNIIDCSKKKFNKDFEKKYRKAKKYYLKKINKNEIYYPPYDINEVSLEEVSFRNIDEISNEALIRKDSFMTKWPIYRAINKVFFIASLITITILIGLIIYGLILNLLV